MVYRLRQFSKCRHDFDSEVRNDGNYFQNLVSYSYSTFHYFPGGSKMFADFLKKRKIYSQWDMWHSYLILAIVLAIVLWANGFD